MTDNLLQKNPLGHGCMKTIEKLRVALAAMGATLLQK